MVDWSASSIPKRGKDSIWYCHLKRTKTGLRRIALKNPPTRHAAFTALHGLLVNSSDRILLGFDFPNAYPQGFAACAGFAATDAPWRTVWDAIAELIEDDPDNRNNRFEVAKQLNRRISATTFPFWACPAAKADALLSPRKTLPHPADLAERRLCERYLPSTQPCWKLAYTGSVGSQALMGIPVKKALRDDPQLCDTTRVWPFETGMAPPAGIHRIILAEIYPSILKVIAKPGQIKDALQVEAIVRCLAGRDETGLLAYDLRGPAELSAEQRRMIEREEGWILGAGTLTKSAWSWSRWQSIRRSSWARSSPCWSGVH
jgi:precorrin-8X/cobalt-precorrin-8 methylmutase